MRKIYVSLGHWGLIEVTNEMAYDLAHAGYQLHFDLN